MLVTYTTTFGAICPVNPKTQDNYQLVLKSSSTIKVEELLDILAGYSLKAMFQEDITLDIAQHFVSSVRVQTTGTHSGVLTVCVVDFAENK